MDGYNNSKNLNIDFSYKILLAGFLSVTKNSFKYWQPDSRGGLGKFEIFLNFRKPGILTQRNGPDCCDDVIFVVLMSDSLGMLKGFLSGFPAIMAGTAAWASAATAVSQATKIRDCCRK